MARISPVSYLIKGALFRSHDSDLSVPTLSIGELVSMYRNHNATKKHDKVYALLGLSSDSNSVALAPDYELPWDEVFRLVAQHVFAKCSVEICYEPEAAIVRGKGWILGYIYSVSDFLMDNQQTFKVASNQICQKLGYRDEWKNEWSLQASGELLQDGDIVCLLEGLSQPSVLRLCADYYTVVTPVVRPEQQVQNTEDDVTVGKNCSAHGLCDIFLGWKVSEPEDKADLESLSRLVENGPNYHKEHCEVERSLNHTTYVMVDAAMQSLRLGIAGKRALDNVLSKGKVKGVDTNFLLSQSNVEVPKDLITVIDTALWQKHELLYAWDKVLAVAVQDIEPCGLIITSILLQRLQEMLPVSEEVVKAAAANVYRGHEIMQLLFQHHGDKLPVSEEVVKAAATNDRQGHEIMQLLFQHHGDKLPVSEEVVKAAAANKFRGDQIMQLLFQYRGDKLPVSEEVVKAAAANDRQGREIMHLLVQHRGDKEEVVKAAAANV
ncbi:hypothetical protein ABHI18_011827, partial [Aspergillus niger]